MPEPASGHVRSLDKAVDLLEALAGESRGLSLAELAKRTGFNPSTAHHLVATLRRRGFVDQDPETRNYRLGYKIVGLANQFLHDADLYTAGVGPIRDLRDASGDTTYLNILQGREVVSVIELPGTRPVQVRRARQPGRTVLHCTATGKVLLAYLPPERLAALLPTLSLSALTPNTLTTLPAIERELAAVREQGYALDREEYLEGLGCVDAPVFARDGTCLAAVSVAYPALDPERWRELVPLVTGAARQISAALGFFDGATLAPTGRLVATA